MNNEEEIKDLKQRVAYLEEWLEHFRNAVHELVIEHRE